MLKEKFAELMNKMREEVVAFYGGRLVSLAVYGSAASETVTPASDLDIFICADDLPRGRRPRLKEFQAIEDRLTPFIKEIKGNGIYTVLSPVIKTPGETQAGSLIFIDMTEDVKILFDRDGFLRNYLNNLKRKLSDLGSRKIKRGSAWFWDLIPDYKLVGEVSL